MEIEPTATPRPGGPARKRISVRGVVQGVGFRPFVYRLAHEHGLAGWVLNHSGGVEIEVEGGTASLKRFVHDLSATAPPLARIVAVEVADAPPEGTNGFEIRNSVSEEGRYQLISPDIATCADCQRELFDPDDRRYRYPFTNCTNCGPRFTIIHDIPYDRRLTTMQPFPMCAECQREYDDPLDRRFHAQPNACPVCGPHVWLEERGAPGAALAEADKAMRQTATALLAGKVIALKGLGGFHLACDATSREAVRTLRQRKGRPAKPLAVMMATIDEVRAHCRVSEEEEAVLRSQSCPIVLLWWRDDSSVSRLVAPENLYLGVMLPYTPLHHILLADAGRPLVMTSGNLSEEPIAQHNEEARQRLRPLADLFLLHNREIYARYDDSVVVCASSPAEGAGRAEKTIEGRLEQGGGGLAGKGRSPGGKLADLANRREHGRASVHSVRRSRGYAPFPVRLPFPVGEILATGPELKNTFCLSRDDFAFISQHVGDMENLETLEHFEQSVALFKHLFRIAPQRVAHDLHPDYLATRYALSPAAAEEQIPRTGIQHHHAHIASCLADNGWPSAGAPVIGVAWDGTGYGLDGRIWGGEFFVGGYAGFRRAAHLEYLPMPGGEAAILNPWRLGLGYLYSLTGEMVRFPDVTDEEARIALQQTQRGLNTPLTSAAGRLFDAVAALAGVRQRVTYEAQAAIELEMLAAAWQEGGEPYPFDLEADGEGHAVRLGSLLAGVQADVAARRKTGEIAWRFHATMAEMITRTCRWLAGTGEERLGTVALSGGCFQNRLLLRLAVPRLEEAGFRVLLHRQVPCNDGGISLGQAVLAGVGTRH